LNEIGLKKTQYNMTYIAVPYYLASYDRRTRNPSLKYEENKI